MSEIGERPPLGKLEVGQKVMVVFPRHYARTVEHIPSRVTKIGRKYVTVESEFPRHAVWRMRLDTQNEGSQYVSGGARFKTIPQYEHDQRAQAAREYLRSCGIDLMYSRTTEWTIIRLANLVRAAEGLEAL